MSPRLRPSLAALVSVFALAACGSSSGRAGFDDSQQPGGGGGGGGGGSPPSPGGFSGQAPPATPPSGPEIHEVFGHSASTLYKLDPDTKAVSVVADFSGCDPVIDLALDENSNVFATSY